MTNKELKSLIETRVLDDDELNLIVVLEGDEFADGAIGLTDDNRVVYSYDRLVKSLALSYCTNEEGVIDGDTLSKEETIQSAIEWLEYNTIRSLSSIELQGLKAPIIIYEF